MLDEQSKVPLVETRRMVGTPAFAVIIRGEYPPFAVISMICFPSRVMAAGDGVTLVSGAGESEAYQKAHPTMTTLTAIEIIVGLFILEIKEWIDNPRGGERVREIKERERNHDNTSGLEENPLPRLVRNIQRSEGE